MPDEETIDPPKESLKGLETLKAAIQAARVAQCEPEGILKLIEGINPPPTDVDSVLFDALNDASFQNWETWEPKMAQETWFGLTKWAAWKNLVLPCLELCENKPGGKPPNLKEQRNLIWLLAGAQDAPGLQNLLKLHTKTKWPEALYDAALWKSANLETESQRKARIREVHPDYDLGSQKWGKYMLGKMKEAGISLELKSKPTKPSTAGAKPDVTILGESHSLPETADFLIDQITKAHKAGIERITVEEPRDASWKPLMAFLMQMPSAATGPKTIFAAAKAFSHDQATANRLGALALCRKLGMTISFVDIPSHEKARRLNVEHAQRRRRIAFGEKFDIRKPETAEGGVRVAAANILQSYHNARRRSKSMAEAILTLHEAAPTQPILHIGGALHAIDIAQFIQNKNTGITTETKFGPLPANPLLHALGKTPNPNHLKKTKEKVSSKSEFPEI